MSVAAAAPVKTVQAAKPPYNYALGYLRGVIVALVVAHHAVLAYHPAAVPVPASLLTYPRVWTGWPVVDSHRAAWAGLFATFNDIFFMALMFFVSGLFVSASLKRKGAGAYLRDRRLRLGIPFLVCAFIIAPFCYYPTWLQIKGHTGFGDFLRQWFSLGSWSAGPVWFCWVLLLFDFLVVGLYLLAPRWDSAPGRLAVAAYNRPALFFVILIALTTALYVPLGVVAGPFNWASWGPFTFQTSRILWYFAYFLAGVAVGAAGIDRGLVGSGSRIARRWPLWAVLAALAFVAQLSAWKALFAHPLPHTFLAAFQSTTVLSALLSNTVSCAASCFALLAIFVCFFHKRFSVLDNLSRNSYGIFVLHFIFVSWLGYAALSANLPASIKFAFVFAGSLALSWIATSLLRRIHAVARIL